MTTYCLLLVVRQIEGWRRSLGSAMLRVAVPLALTVAVGLLADASSRLLGGFSGIRVYFAMGPGLLDSFQSKVVLIAASSWVIGKV